MTTMRSINPATGDTLAEHPMLSAEELERRLALAAEAAPRWRRTPVAERAAVVARLGALLDAEKDRLGRLMTLEMGKPIQAAIDEAAKCATGCRFYAEHGPSFVADTVIDDEGHRSFVSYQPLGVVLAIMPWNFPFWQVIRFAAPALMAGNAALLKHSPNVTGCALAIEEVFREAGYPDGLFRALVIAEPDVPAATGALIEHPQVAAVTLTGSERAGVAVGTAAGRALKRSVLELGGSDPFVVLADADVAGAARVAARARFLNTGQSCIAAKRFVVEEPVADEFERLFVEAVRDLRVGDPADPSTDVGPMARADLMDALERQVSASVEAGARVLQGGERIAGTGYFFAPTVLADVTADMPVFAEETFGPVAALIRARDEDDAVRLANETPFGLGASVWTSDVERGQRVGRQIRSGALFVNSMVASDPRLPFGGTKRSGYGRELAAEGIREFTNVRTFWVQAGPPADTPLSE